MSKSPFLSALSDFMRVRCYSKRTISTYLHWIKAYIRFSKLEHPKNLSEQDVEAFLTYLAVNRQVSSATQSLALNALAFLYNQYLEQPLENANHFRKSKKQAKLPVILTKSEVSSLLAAVDPRHRLMVCLLYGSGLRRIELLRLRVNDIDADNLQVRVWNGKGYKHRLTTLAPELLPAIRKQMNKVDEYLTLDLENMEFSGAWLPDALARKYPSAPK